MAIPKPEPRDWLTAAAQELQLGDRETLAILRDAYKAVQKELEDLPSDDGAAFGKLIQRAQMERVKQKLLAQQADLFDKLGDKVAARRLRSASRAAKLSRTADNALLLLVGKGDEGKRLYDGANITAQRTVDTLLARMGLSQVPLAERIYRTGIWMNGRLDRLITGAMSTGLNAQKFAKIARDWFNPAVPGGTRYAALRLARTEINNAFHATSVAYAQDKPWVSQMDWNLSKSHPTPDKCDEYAALSPWDVIAVPRKPHPQCMCYVTEVTPSEDDWIDRFVAGEFDDYLDDALAKEDAKLGIKQPTQKPVKLPSAAPKPAPESLPIAPKKPTLIEELSGQAAHDIVPKGLLKRGSMTENQRRAVKTYETGWFTVINGFLRDKLWGDPDYKTEERDIGRMDSAMDESVLPQPIQTWRGIRNADRLFGDKIHQDLTGFSWQELGYGSTTTLESITDQFMLQARNDDRIRKAYLQLSGNPGVPISLADLRDKLSDLSRADLDRFLLQMNREGLIDLEPEVNRRRLDDRARAAGILLGGENVHMINIRADNLKVQDLGNVKLKVHVSAGVKAIEVSTQTKGNKDNGPQAEIVLQHDLIWKVVKDHGTDPEGVRHLEVQVDIAS
jgi:hypothetical protein